jgi:hypothetical protein
MLLKNFSIFLQKMRRFFYAQTLQASLGFGQKKPPSKAERFLVGKSTGVSNLLIDIESVFKF